MHLSERGPEAKYVPDDWQGLLLAGLFFWFAYAHFTFWLRHPGQFVGFGLVILQTLEATLFLIRRRSTVNRRPMSVWFATAVGSWGFLLARPDAAGVGSIAWLFKADVVGGTDLPWIVLQLVGVVLAVLSLGALGRSFALLPGNRGICTSGPYRFVRHPVYASYLMTDAGYLCESFSLWNLTLFFIVLIAQLARMYQEERFLASDPKYREYSRLVRYRLIPGAY